MCWIKTLPCTICGRLATDYFCVEAAHTTALGPGGMSQKTHDLSCIPLCIEHHQSGASSIHKLGAPAFENRWSLDIRASVAELNRIWKTYVEKTYKPIDLRAFGPG